LRVGAKTRRPGKLDNCPSKFAKADADVGYGIAACAVTAIGLSTPLLDIPSTIHILHLYSLDNHESLFVCSSLPLRSSCGASLSSSSSTEQNGVNSASTSHIQVISVIQSQLSTRFFHD